MRVRAREHRGRRAGGAQLACVLSDGGRRGAGRARGRRNRAGTSASAPVQSSREKRSAVASGLGRSLLLAEGQFPAQAWLNIDSARRDKAAWPRRAALARKGHQDGRAGAKVGAPNGDKGAHGGPLIWLRASLVWSCQRGDESANGGLQLN